MSHVTQTAPAQPGQCHATGTLIDVQVGRKPVEDLQPGDLVRTKDNGFQPVRRVASRLLTADAMKADPALRPIRIRAGALGEAKPERDLVVSPQHCVLLDDWRCALLFGEDEMLAPAAALVNDCTITVDHGASQVTYYHLLFDGPEIIFSNGAETESYHPGDAGTEAAADARNGELEKLFPEIACDPDSFGPHTRATLREHEVEVLMAM